MVLAAEDHLYNEYLILERGLVFLPFFIQKKGEVVLHECLKHLPLPTHTCIQIKSAKKVNNLTWSSIWQSQHFWNSFLVCRYELALTWTSGTLFSVLSSYPYLELRYTDACSTFLTKLNIRMLTKFHIYLQFQEKDNCKNWLVVINSKENLLYTIEHVQNALQLWTWWRTILL